jgi:hypothetical protein
VSVLLSCFVFETDLLSLHGTRDFLCFLLIHESLYKPAFVLSTNHPSPCHAPKWREIGFVPAPAIFVFGFNQVLSLQQDNHVHHVSGFRYGLHEIEGDSASANPRTNTSIDLGFARGVSSDEQP